MEPRLRMDTLKFAKGIGLIAFILLVVAFTAALRPLSTDEAAVIVNEGHELPATGIAAQIEDWSRYAVDDTVVLGTSEECEGTSAFTELLVSLGAGEKRTQLLNDGLTLVTTPNPTGLETETFVAFRDDDTAYCSAGGIYPLRAYDDRLLWSGVCSTGTEPEADTPAHDAFLRCEEARAAVSWYFAGVDEKLPITLDVPDGWKVEYTEYEINTVEGGGPIRGAFATPVGVDWYESPHVSVHLYAFNPDAGLPDFARHVWGSMESGSLGPTGATTTAVTVSSVAGKDAYHRIVDGMTTEGTESWYRSEDYLARYDLETALSVHIFYPTEEVFTDRQEEAGNIVDSIEIIR